MLKILLVKMSVSVYNVIILCHSFVMEFDFAYFEVIITGYNRRLQLELTVVFCNKRFKSEDTIICYNQRPQIQVTFRGYN